MKKILKTILILIITYLVLYLILSTMLDEDTAFTYSATITLFIAIVYNFTMLLIEIDKYSKNGEVSQSALDAAMIIYALIGIKDSTLSALTNAALTQGAISKAEKSKKTLLCTSILLRIGMIFLLTSLICNLMEINLFETITLVIGLIALFSSALLPMAYGAEELKKENYDNLEKMAEETQKRRTSNALTYDKNEYKKHVLPKNIIISIMLALIYPIMFYKGIHQIIFPPFIELIALAIVFVPAIYWLNLLIGRTKQKLMAIILNPLSISITYPRTRMVTNDYQSKVETIFFDKITSYKVTNSQIIIYGDIERLIRQTYNNNSKEKTKKLKVYKIPRAFNNIEALINVLNQSINK